MNLQNNTILISGAGTGMGLAAARWYSSQGDRVITGYHNNTVSLGLAAARWYSSQGDRVIMVARNEERLKIEASRLKNASYIVCDFSQPAQLESLVKEIKEKYPDLNMVFLNAGIATNYTLLDSDDAFEISKKEMATNYHPVVYLTHHLEPILASKKNASFVITTSGVAFVPDILHPTYSATKAALHNYIVGLRLVLQRKNSSIEVYELMAPLVDSPFSKAIESDLKVSPESVIERLIIGLKNKEFEIRPGLTQNIYQAYLRSPEEALLLLNNSTGA